MSIQQISERETALTNALRQMTEALTLVTKERDRLSALADKWNLECDEMREDNKRMAKELKSLRDSGVELPEMTVIDMHIPTGYRIRGYTEAQIRDYGDRRAMAERERCAKICDDIDEPAWYGYECPNTFTDAKIMCAEAIRKGE